MTAVSRDIERVTLQTKENRERTMGEEDLRTMLIAGIFDSFVGIPECPKHGAKAIRNHKDRINKIKDDLDQLNDSTLYWIYDAIYKINKQ